MGDYLRSTRACPFASLTPALADAIRAYVGQHSLAVPEAALGCWETVSTKKKKGLFGGKPEVILTGVVIAPPMLIWAAGKQNEKPAVLSARLRDIQVQDYEASSMHKLVPDTGVSVSGLRTDSSGAGLSFIGLGPEPAAQQFRAALAAALAM